MTDPTPCFHGNHDPINGDTCRYCRVCGVVLGNDLQPVRTRAEAHAQMCGVKLRRDADHICRCNQQSCHVSPYVMHQCRCGSVWRNSSEVPVMRPELSPRCEATHTHLNGRTVQCQYNLANHSPHQHKCGCGYCWSIEPNDIANIDTDWTFLFTGTSDTARRRRSLLRRDGPGCHYCGREGERPTLDHVTPQSRGGSNALWNLVLACPKCNSEKGDLPLAEWVDRWYLRGVILNDACVG